MEPENRDTSLRRRRVALSSAAIVFGVVMMVAVLTPFGPSPIIGMVFGGALVLYGALRLYQALKN